MVRATKDTMYMFEWANLDYITGVTINSGQGTIEWAVTGTEA